ncbi:MAG: hypothetical protein SGARI_002223 [Bacillariaceae sp.]
MQQQQQQGYRPQQSGQPQQGYRPQQSGQQQPQQGQPGQQPQFQQGQPQPGQQVQPTSQPQGGTPAAAVAPQVPPQRRVSRAPSQTRRNSKTTASKAAPSVAKTPEPHSTEARLSLTGAAAARSPGPHLAPLVGERIADLVKSIDPNYVIDPDAEEQVLQLADDFLDKVTRQATRLAQHRGSKVVDVQDLQIVLAKNFGIVVPGLGLPTIRPSKSSTSAAAKRKSATAASGDGPARKKSGTASGMAAAAAAAAAATQGS